MSREQNYFPPSGTKYKWSPKTLRHSPWYCSITDQHKTSKGLQYWPANVSATVWLKNGEYFYKVVVTKWDGKLKSQAIFLEKSTDALEACLKAEKIGDREIKKLFTKWVVEALKNKWRPPAQDTFT